MTNAYSIYWHSIKKYMPQIKRHTLITCKTEDGAKHILQRCFGTKTKITKITQLKNKRERI